MCFERCLYDGLERYMRICSFLRVCWYEYIAHAPVGEKPSKPQVRLECLEALLHHPKLAR